jgi:hypothetical protein
MPEIQKIEQFHKLSFTAILGILREVDYGVDELFSMVSTDHIGFLALQAIVQLNGA